MKKFFNFQIKMRIIMPVLLAALLFTAIGMTEVGGAEKRNAKEFTDSAFREIRSTEIKAETASDPYQKAELYKDAYETAIKYHRESVMEFDNFDQPIDLPSLGSNELHITTNYLKYSKTIIAQKEKELEAAQDPMARFKALEGLLRFTFDALKMSQSALFDPSKTPRLGRDELREATNLVRGCELIMSDLKNQYDPISCEGGAVASRDLLMKNMKKVESWCASNGLSEIFSPELLPNYFGDPYGTRALYSHRVCGVVPDAETFDTEWPENNYNTQPPGRPIKPLVPTPPEDYADSSRCAELESLIVANSDKQALCNSEFPDCQDNCRTGAVGCGNKCHIKLDACNQDNEARCGSYMSSEWSKCALPCDDQYDQCVNEGCTPNFGQEACHSQCYDKLLGCLEPYKQKHKELVKEFNSLCSDVSLKLSEEKEANKDEKADSILDKKIISDNSVTPALASDAPTESDIVFAPTDGDDKKNILTAVVTTLEGTADMRLADGKWMVIEKGSFVPPGATIFTGYGSTMKVQFSDRLVVELDSLSELNLHQYETDASMYRQELKLESGALRFKMLEADFKTDMRVSTPNASASPSGTDFAVSYLKGLDASLWEIYDGSIIVTDETHSSSKTISSSYGSPIRQLKVAGDGSMIDKTAIPKNEWENFFSQMVLSGPVDNLKKETSTRWGLWIVVGILTIGAGYVVYRIRFAKTYLDKDSQGDLPKK